VVAHSIREILDTTGVEGGFVGTSLRRDSRQREEIRAAVATGHCHGVAVDWRQVQPDGRLIDLPGYPWQHRRYWRNPSGAGRTAAGGHDIDTHTLLGNGTAVAGMPVRLWSTTLTDDSRPYPGSHQVFGVEVVPAAVLALTFLAAARGGDQTTLRDLSMTAPLTTAGRQEIQVVDDDGVLRLAAREAGAGDKDWLVHATAQAGTAQAPTGAAPPQRAGAPSGRVRSADPGLVRQRLAQVGVPATAFAWNVERLLVGEGVVRARVSVPPDTPATWAAVLDATMSIAPMALSGPPLLRMVDHADLIRTTGEPPDAVLIEVTAGAGADTVDARVSAGSREVARLEGLRYPVVPQADATGGTDLAGEAGEAERAAQPLATRDPERLREQLLSEVAEVIATEMRLAPTALDARRPLVQQGLDSVMTVVIRRRLERRYGQILPAALFWQQPTIAGIAEHLATVLSALHSPDVQPAAPADA
jgi:6-methylsalicylic acid synthase